MPRPIVSYHPGLEADINLMLVSQRPLDERDREATGQAAAILLPQICRADLFELAQASGAPFSPIRRCI